MKTIKLNVTCSYDVEMTVGVPDNIYEAMRDRYDRSDGSIDNCEAMDWLADNVKERDGYNWEYTINEIEEQ